MDTTFDFTTNSIDGEPIDSPTILCLNEEVEFENITEWDTLD